jgi:hypothetical protein
MLVRVAIAVALIFTQIAPVPAANAVEPLTPILSCTTDPNFACIEKINVITGDGERITAKLSNIRIAEVRTYAPTSVLNASWQVYEVPGIKLSDGSGGRFLIRPFYFPLGNLDCFYTPCVSGGEYLEFAIAPITYEGKSNLKDLGYSYEIYFRVPESFLMTASNGRGMRILEISKLSDTEMSLKPGFKNYRLTIEPMAYSSFALKEALNGNLVDKASEESDNGAVWFWGSRDSRMATFGECKSLEAVSVTGNVFYLNSPQWNPVAKNIEVSTTAPHYKSDGSVNLGYFQAKVTTEMAKCLWGIDLSKVIDAKISLTYENGDQVQVETWSGKLAGNVYVLTASGFHFSSPKISFKLVEERKVEVNPTPSQTPAVSLIPEVVKTKKTISCIKGKVVKKVTAFSPKCPKGYKKKN